MADVQAPEQRRDLGAAALRHRGDRVFNRIITGAAFFALVILAGITIFLGAQTIPVLKTQGLSFLTTSVWDPPDYGIWGMLYGSLLLAVIALCIAVPVSLLLSVFMVFLSPKPVASCAMPAAPGRPASVARPPQNTARTPRRGACPGGPWQPWPPTTPPCA